MTYCRNCGSGLHTDAKFCGNCGAPVEPVTTSFEKTTTYTAHTSAPSGEKHSAQTMLLICVFLGTLGVHKFVEGEILMGFVYLFTGGLFSIGWVIDIIKYANQTMR